MRANENSSAFLFVKKYPFFRILISLISGILMQWHLQISVQKWMITLSATLVCLLFFRLLPLSYRFKWSWLQGIFILTAVTISGGMLMHVHDIRHNRAWIGNVLQSSDAYVVTLTEPVIEKAKTLKATATVVATYDRGKIQTATGNIIVYLPKDSVSATLGYGNVLLLYKALQPIENSKNFAAFDYKSYCARQNIYHQVFLRKGDFIMLDKTNRSFLKQLFFTIRNKVLTTLEQHIEHKRELGVAQALLIGYRNNLDKEVLQAYINTGVVHLIAISGLHVGMIYGLLVLLFSIIPDVKVKRWLQPVVILFLLWLFACITGAGASVMRSTVMFSFIVLGSYANKKNSIYNNLAASAFCLLIYNPFLLWDIGFQLSYAAVLSIALFQKPIASWVTLDNKILCHIWSMVSITIAAQVFVTPISIYYFHQFSNLFLFSNLLAIPVSSIVLYSEILLLMLSPFGNLASYVGKLTESCLYLMNAIVDFFNSIPFAITHNLSLSLLETILLYVLICGGYLWAKKRR